MRIAVVCSDLGVRVPGNKGASLHLQAITAALDRVGHEVVLIGVEGHGDPWVTTPALLVKHPGRASGLRRELRKLATVEAIVRAATPVVHAFRPDVVYERLSLFGTAGVRLASIRGSLHAVEVNALLAEEEARWRGLHLKKLARSRERRVLRRAHLRVAVSEEVAHAVRSVAGGDATVVVPNGVDTDLFAELPEKRAARQQLGVQATGPLIGFVGSLRPWHGLDVLIEALALLDDGVLAVAGDGPIREELQRLAAQRRVDHRVKWVGHLEHARIPAFLAAIDVAVAPYPSLPEFGFSPLKLYEYLAAGVPIVASDLGQIRDVLDAGRLGRLVTPGDPEALSQALHHVLTHPDTSAAQAAEGRRVALHAHSWEQRAHQLVESLHRAHNVALAR